ncbi:MAG: hypothetical protein M1308_06060 [Actinobacteria bacterium]|nr:hypothetical protein [Actinomycetota bacterium]
MNILTIGEIIIAIVAVYGAVISTITLTSQRREKQRLLDVKLYHGFPYYGPNIGEPMLYIEILNPGLLDVTINIPSLILPDRKTVVFPNPQSNANFPYILKEGTNCKVWTEIKDLAQTLKENGYSGIIKIYAKVEDGAGNTYKSQRPWKLDVDKWSK